MKLKGKRLYETDSVKYLGTRINKRLIWKQQVSHVALKLNKANAVLSKVCINCKNSGVSFLCNIGVPFMLCFTCVSVKH